MKKLLLMVLFAIYCTSYSTAECSKDMYQNLVKRGAVPVESYSTLSNDELTFLLTTAVECENVALHKLQPLDNIKDADKDKQQLIEELTIRKDIYVFDDIIESVLYDTISSMTDTGEPDASNPKIKQ